MMTTCPECAAAFDIPALGPGEAAREIRCGACGAAWIEAPSRAALALPPRPALTKIDGRALALSHPGRSRPWTDRPASRRGVPLGRAAAVLAAVTVGSALGVTAADPSLIERGRAAIETALFGEGAPPPDEAPFGAPRGAVFAAHGFDLVTRPEGPAVEVWGRVANNGPGAIAAPLIDITTRDAGDAPLQRWTARAEKDLLQPGESARFSSRMMYPAGPVMGVELSLSPRPLSAAASAATWRATAMAERR